MLKIGVIGAVGRMGDQMVKAICASDAYFLAGAFVRSESPAVGQVVSGSNILYEESNVRDFAACDVLVDFSSHESALQHVKWAREAGRPICLCQTALSEQDKSKIDEITQEAPILMAPNTSLGIALLKRFSMEAAKHLGSSYDIEILEMHHRHKKDAPSGTVMQLGEEIGKLEGYQFKADADRNGVRQKGDIGYAVLRGGGVPADQEVMFASDDEVFSLKHRALDRSLFVKGALRAAKWISQKDPGLYTMDDVLGF